MAVAQCPFCVGHESMTPPEVIAYRPDGSAPDTPGWQVRVVPNLYPAFGPPNGEARSEADGPYLKMNGVGVHEVIISSPDHRVDISGLTGAEADLVVQAWIDRIRANQSNSNVEYLLLINNHGKEAGASLEHPHSQLFGIPVLPPVYEEEQAGVHRYRSKHRRCVYCDIVGEEMSARARVIFENERFLVFAPYASRTPFESQILPKTHGSRFETLTSYERAAFAEALQSLTGRLERGLNDPPYNFFIHTAPPHASPDVDYHWHLELLPKLAIAAGFELGSGVMINVTTPESAAEFLRGVEPNSAAAPPIATPAIH
jgi:UDPglucose--hexose-1-phosphate uridylyltransferase